MKLYWSSRSPFVRKVMVCAHETGLAARIELDRTLVVMSKPNAALMKVNPLGKIPTLVTDEGRALYDSLVICEYLDSLHGGPRLFPPSGDARWQALTWHALGNGMLDNAVPWRYEVLKPKREQGHELLAAFEAKIRNAIDALEHEAPQLDGTACGIGHIAIGVALGYLDFRFGALGWRTGHPRIAAWHERFAQRPSAVATAHVDA
jgi:glutathione S-transferase